MLTFSTFVPPNVNWVTALDSLANIALPAALANTGPVLLKALSSLGSALPNDSG